MSTIETLFQVIAVTNVGRVDVTPAAQDPETGDFVREIRVMGKTGNGQNMPAVLVLRINGEAAEDVTLRAPEQMF